MLIADAVDTVGPVLDIEPAEPPSNAELRGTLAATAASLREAAAQVADFPRRGLGAPAGGRAGPPRRRHAGGTRGRRGRSRAAAQDHAGAGSRDAVQAGPVSLESLPHALVDDWTTPAMAAPACWSCRTTTATTRRCCASCRRSRPSRPTQRAGRSSPAPRATASSTRSCRPGPLLSTITLLLVVVLRRVRDVVLTMLPVVLSGLLTFATCAALDLPLNFTNIIALPLLFGIGVAFNIYFVLAWRAGETAMLQSSLMRAVVFSALVTATAFGALWLSSHPGTASMGRLLMISLGWELLVTNCSVRPALLALPPARHGHPAVPSSSG